jgi:hypothetical protein
MLQSLRIPRQVRSESVMSLDLGRRFVDIEWQAARDISTLVARDDASLSPRFVVVSN